MNRSRQLISYINGAIGFLTIFYTPFLLFLIPLVILYAVALNLPEVRHKQTVCSQPVSLGLWDQYEVQVHEKFMRTTLW